MISQRVTVGMDLGGTKLLIEGGGYCQTMQTGPDFSPQDLVDCFLDFCKTYRLFPDVVGLAVPGLVDMSGVIVDCDVLPQLTGWKAREVLTKSLGKISEVKSSPHIVIANDVKAGLIEEFSEESGQGFCGVLVMAGTAIGCGMILDGKVIRGAGGWAGELGYWPLPVGQQVFRLDEIAGGRFMADRLGVRAAELLERTRAGDEDACQIIQEGGTALGHVLAGVINLLNPNVVAVGGGALRLPGYWRAVTQAADAGMLPLMRPDFVMRKAGDQCDRPECLVARGAVRMALQSFS